MMRFKYPRTPHLPWSPGASADDVFCMDTSMFEGLPVVVTEKMDGENTTLYCDHLHARSIDSKHHPSRNWVKSFHAQIAAEIPQGWRICGENMYARHSIAYQALRSYFYGFSIWTEQNACLSWDETLEWFALLGICAPNELYRGIWDERKIRQLQFNPLQVEGYVVRVQAGFAYQDFSRCVAKWVRANHVQTDQHWMHSAIVPNILAEDV